MTVVLIVFVAIVVVAWLTASAAAVRSVSRIWLRHWAERGGRGSDVVASYLERPQRLLLAAGTAVMLTASLAGLALGAAESDRPLVTVARVAVAALLLLLLGQLVPRAVGRRWGVALVPVLLPVLRVVDLVLGPPADAVRRAAARGGAPPTAPEDEQRDALEDLLREGELEGVSAGEEAAIISGVVQFGHKRVTDVMTPREAIFALDAALPADRIAREVAQSGYSRVPVYDGSLDAPVGMVRVFDIIKAGGAAMPWRPIAEAAPDAHCNELLARMLRAQLHMVLVRDAGRTVGLVTLEDLLEELVGDIRDEHDEPQRPASPTPALGVAPAPPRS